MYLQYPSSLDPELKLFAEFHIPEKPAFLRLHFHGWHGAVKTAHRDNVSAQTADAEWFMIEVEMRGRGDSTGKPDCNGFELQDAVDAVEFAKKRFADKIKEPEKVFLSGGSGGGGNVYAILGKFPDYFCRAHADCGISDYAEWYRHDLIGEFRDELETDGWIGGNPDANSEAYRSRSGITSIGNLLTPLLIFHGEKDIRVPAVHARNIVEAAQKADKWALIHYFELKDCGGADHWSGITPEITAFRESTAAAFLALPVQPPRLPARGTLTVCGYLKTAAFDVILDSIDRVATLTYDLERGYFHVDAQAEIRRK